MSYLVSCGLLGEIPENELASLPRSTKINSLAIPNVTLSIVDANGTEHEISFAYGKSLSVSDITKKLPADFSLPSDKAVYKYQIKNDDDTYSDVSFPYTAISSETLYARFKIKAPEIISAELTSVTLERDIVTVVWSEVPSAQLYEIGYTNSTHDAFGTITVEAPILWFDLSLSPTVATYKITLRAYDLENDEWSDYSEIMTVSTW